MDLGDEVYVGLFVGSHNPDVAETGVFKDVRITVPFPGIADQTTQMNLGSNLELLEVATGNREIGGIGDARDIRVAGGIDGNGVGLFAAA